jgi:hypothetical protein
MIIGVIGFVISLFLYFQARRDYATRGGPPPPPPL